MVFKNMKEVWGATIQAVWILFALFLLNAIFPAIPALLTRPFLALNNFILLIALTVAIPIGRMLQDTFMKGR